MTTSEFAAELSLHFARGDDMRPYPLHTQRRNFTDPAVASALEAYHQSQQPQHLQQLHDTLLQRLPSSMRRFAHHFVANGSVATYEADVTNAELNHSDEVEGPTKPDHKGYVMIKRLRGETHMLVAHDNERGGQTRAIYTVPDDVPEDLHPSRPWTRKQQDSLRTTNTRKRLRPVE